eukprot:8989905-Pyramimonas_sp.AAC.1
MRSLFEPSTWPCWCRPSAVRPMEAEIQTQPWLRGTVAGHVWAPLHRQLLAPAIARLSRAYSLRRPEAATARPSHTIWSLPL